MADAITINDCLVIRETLTTSKPKKIQINRKWPTSFSHRSLHRLRYNFISLSTQYNLILRLSCRLSNSSTKSSKSIFSDRIFQLKVDQRYLIFH